MYRNGLIFVDTLPRDNRGSLNFQVGQLKLPYFAKISVCDNRGRPNFEVTSTKLLYSWEKFTL